MLYDIAANLLGLVWAILVVAWTCCAVHVHRKWFGDARNPVSITAWGVIAIGALWALTALPAVVSLTLAP